MAEEFDFSKKRVKKVFSIEKAMANGVDSMIDAIIEGSLKLSKREIQMYSALINEPFFSEDIKQEILLKKFEKGFFSKNMAKAWEKFTGAFKSIYYNKRVRRALRKSQFNNDW